MAVSLTKPVTILDATESLRLVQLLHALGFDAYNRDNGGALDHLRPVIDRLRETANARLAFADETLLGDSEAMVHPSSVELTTKQVAKATDMSEQRVTALARAGRLKARQVGRNWLFDAGSVEAFIEGRARKGEHG